MSIREKIKIGELPECDSLSRSRWVVLQWFLVPPQRALLSIGRRNWNSVTSLLRSRRKPKNDPVQWYTRYKQASVECWFLVEKLRGRLTFDLPFCSLPPPFTTHLPRRWWSAASQWTKMADYLKFHWMFENVRGVATWSDPPSPSFAPRNSIWPVLQCTQSTIAEHNCPEVI